MANKNSIDSEIIFFTKDYYQPEIQVKLEEWQKEYVQIQHILKFGNQNIQTYYNDMAIKGCNHRKGEIKAMVENINNPKPKNKLLADASKLVCKLDPVAYNSMSKNSNIIVIANISQTGKGKKQKSKITLEVDVNTFDEKGMCSVFQREAISGLKFDLEVCKTLINKKLIEYDWVLKSDLY